MIARTSLLVGLLVLAAVSADATTSNRIIDTSSIARDDVSVQKKNAINKIRKRQRQARQRRQLGEMQGIMNDPRVDVDPTTLTEEEIEEMTSEELEEEDEYIGCLCPCDLPDHEEGVLIHTHDMALEAETEVRDHQSGDEKPMASHVLCVDDLLSIEFVAEGRGNCDKECFFKPSDDELDTGAEDSIEEFSPEDSLTSDEDDLEDEFLSKSGDEPSSSGEGSDSDEDSDSDSDDEDGGEGSDSGSDSDSDEDSDSDSDEDGSSSSSSEGDGSTSESGSSSEGVSDGDGSEDIDSDEGEEEESP